MTFGFRSYRLVPAVAAIAALLGVGTLASCGLDSTNRSSIPPEQLKEFAALASNTSRLSDLEQSAYVQNTLLQFASAEQDYRETLSLARKLFPTDPALASSLRLNLALNKSNLGQFETAEQLFDRSRGLVEKLGVPSEQAKPDLFYAQHMMNLKQFDRAEEIARRAGNRLDALIAKFADGQGEDADRLALERRADGTLMLEQEQAEIVNARIERDTRVGGDAPELTVLGRLILQRVQARYIIARAMMARGEPRSAIAPLIDTAEVELAKVPEVYGGWLRAEIASLRAGLLSAQGKKKEAILELQDAVRMLRKYRLDTRPEALLLLKVGELQVETGQEAAGSDAYQRALDILQNDKQGIEVGQASSLIEKLLADAQAGRADAKDQLFLLMQEVRSAATAKTVAQLSARLASGSGERARAIRALQDLEREQNVLAARFDQLEADPDADLHYKRVIEDKLDQVRRGIVEGRAQLERLAPNYDQLIGASVSLEQAQAALTDGEVMAIIQLGAEKGLVAVVTNVSFQAYEIPLGIEAAEKIVRELRKPMDGSFLTAFDVGRSHDLFRMLFAPVARTINEAKHLIVVPTGSLLSLPFGILVTEAYDKEIEIVGTDPFKAYFDYSDVSWLGRKVAITTGVSIASFFLGRETPASEASDPFRGFGDFEPFGDDPAAVERIVESHGLPESCKSSIRALGLLNELNGTAGELQKIKDILDVPAEDIVTGAEFTDTAVKEMNLAQFRVLHFATHGLLAQDPQCLPEPGLVTSLGKTGDGLLEASEIVNLKLDAVLVVMSACDTGAGAGAAASQVIGFRGAGGSYAAGGESLNGLARSFFFAGARNIMSTHWSVDDRATQKLVSVFYRKASGKDAVTIAEAMRASQEKLIEGGELSHPFFWAPFAVIGDGARKLNIDGDNTAGSVEANGDAPAAVAPEAAAVATPASGGA